jgi:hypothetical protein
MQEACLEADRECLSLTTSSAEPAPHPGFDNRDYAHENNSYGSYAHENDGRPGDCGSLDDFLPDFLAARPTRVLLRGTARRDKHKNEERAV